MSEFIHDFGEELPENADELLCQRLLNLPDMLPDSGSVALGGLTTSTADHKMLEAMFGRSLSRNNSEVYIRFDSSREIKLTKLKIPLEKDPESSLVIQLDDVNDRMFTTLENSDQIPTNNSDIDKDYVYQDDFEDRLLQAYELTPPPTEKRGYSRWRYDLLDRACKWSLKEQNIIAQNLASEDTDGEVLLTREMRYSDYNESDILDRTALYHIISLFPTNPTDRVMKFAEEISVNEYAKGQRRFNRVQMYEGLKDIVTFDKSSNRAEIPLTPETYRRFDDLLALAEQSNAEVA